MQAKVVLLDGSLFTCTLEVRQAGRQTDRHVGDIVITLQVCVCVQKRSRGLLLFEKVCEHVNLLEKDYFSLSFRDSDNNQVPVRL